MKKTIIIAILGVVVCTSLFPQEKKFGMKQKSKRLKE